MHFYVLLSSLLKKRDVSPTNIITWTLNHINQIFCLVCYKTLNITLTPFFFFLIDDYHIRNDQIEFDPELFCDVCFVGQAFTVLSFILLALL